jgi:repressor of nif and glnA expression
MMNQQANDVERKEAAILKVLSDSARPLGGRVLARRLGDLGIDLGERAVRYHLKLMDERGLTKPVGRKDGRSITESGIEELGSALVTDRLGLMTTRIGTLAYQSSFEPRKRLGKVPINVSLFSPEEFSQAMEVMKDAFLTGLLIGDLIAVAPEGEKLGEVMVPPGNLGLATLSHIVICGALLGAGIPVEPRFGGILQVKNHEALRFVDIIDYGGCSFDPSEVFIAGRMTSVRNAAREGSGKILASFYEIPAVARLKVEMVIKELETAGMKGLLALGRAGEPVFQCPVAANSIGMVLADGLNPVAAAVEAGIKAINHAMSGFIDFGKMSHFDSYHLTGR